MLSGIDSLRLICFMPGLDLRLLFADGLFNLQQEQQDESDDICSEMPDASGHRSDLGTLKI